MADLNDADLKKKFVQLQQQQQAKLEKRRKKKQDQKGKSDSQNVANNNSKNELNGDNNKPAFGVDDELDLKVLKFYFMMTQHYKIIKNVKLKYWFLLNVILSDAFHICYYINYTNIFCYQKLHFSNLQLKIYKLVYKFMTNFICRTTYFQLCF